MMGGGFIWEEVSFLSHDMMTNFTTTTMTMIYETTSRILRRVVEGFKSKYVGQEVS
jgi:hypothetical protein